jgi:hypothetical protein
MPHPTQHARRFKTIRLAMPIALFAAVLGAAHSVDAQNTPLISGGAGFQTNTTAGNTTYTPIIEPLLEAPIGRHFQIESRAALLESWAPRGGGQTGYDHTHFIGLTYLRGDYIANSHLTVIGGSFLLPYASYNERLSPIWISNFQDGPLSSNIGLMGGGTGLGFQLRGSAVSRPKYSLAYASYFSARSNNVQFTANRSAGGRASLYLPEQRLEIGLSYSRLLQGVKENFFATHIWWEPKDTNLRVRSEFNRGQHAQGYWIEGDYRLAHFGGPETFVGRFEPLFRMQQTFRLDNSTIRDGAPAANTQRVDFGLNYNLPHNARLITSYSRQLSSTRNENIWETGVVYRFLFPAWKGK